ncbi:AraC family transcriptional regulator [Paenibacillus sp. OAS669]|uniref:AraC family transcriptional regulator n=1 Tax=Paenibacillus sp. OAS669 TaxID=2663821 RepID=UPI00178AC227|nr:AraC family transcriptional regulator [Paenibacillus sp. OAS669]MBE1444864.1 AraC-like DNA-binding protein [Paenibacillus sp. OAS669]
MKVNEAADPSVRTSAAAPGFIVKRDYNLNKNFPIHISRWMPSIFMEPFHWHTSFEVGYCMEGKGLFHFEDKRYEINTGDVFVVSHMEQHRAQSDPLKPCQFHFLKFDGSLIDGGENELLAPFFMKSPYFGNKIDGNQQTAVQIGALLRDIWSEMQEQDRAYTSMVRGLLIQVCTHLFRHYAKEIPAEEWNRSLQAYKKLQPALGLIHHQYHENIQLKDLAASLSLSTSRAYHLFKETMGEGFKEYLTKIRIHESKKRLSDPNVSITEVYLSCGFQGHASFYRSFKQIVGMTPKEFRKYMLTL